jgi:hypothetical protein
VNFDGLRQVVVIIRGIHDAIPGGWMMGTGGEAYDDAEKRPFHITVIPAIR